MRLGPIRLRAALLVALAVLAAVPATASAVLSGRNGRIAFTSGREGANDDLAQLYLRGAAGSSGFGSLSGPITPVGGQSRHPSWSPDRTKIVFANGTPGSFTTENYDLFVKDMEDGSITPLDATQIGDNKSSDHPAWSPDGRFIAYEEMPSAGSGDRDIKVKTFGTAAPATTFASGPGVQLKPAWSPDSQEVYYATEVSHPPVDFDIVKKPVGGGTETPVISTSGMEDYQPSISPDGSQICFTRQAIGPPPSNSQTADIYTAPLPTGSPLTLISNDATKGDINCTWSPDGARIAYVNGTFSQGRLVMERSDGSDTDPVQLEDDQGSNNFDGNPDWAPDGSPECPDSTVTTRPNTPITIELECTDTGPQYERTDPNGFVANDGDPQHGTASDGEPLANPSTVRYTPNQGFAGKDRIIFTSFDDFGFGTDRGTVTINVAPPCNGRTPTIFGDVGADTIVGTSGADVISTVGGNDSVRAGRGADRVCLGDGNDTARGGSGNDRLYGERGRDRLFGQSGRDRLFGGSGADRLFGGPGRDRLSGGPGRDRQRQ